MGAEKGKRQRMRAGRVRAVDSRSVKAKVLAAIRSLPADVTWSELMHRLEVMEDLDCAREDAAAGRVALMPPKREVRFQRAPRLELEAAIGEAKRVFGSTKGAMNWLRAELPALGFKAPLEVLGTKQGLDRVKTLLGRIEYGMCA